MRTVRYKGGATRAELLKTELVQKLCSPTTQCNREKPGEPPKTEQSPRTFLLFNLLDAVYKPSVPVLPESSKIEKT